MHIVEEHYYSINKTVLQFLGIWPHDKSRLVFIQRMLIITLTVSHIILQLSVFITTKCDVDLFVKTMSLVFPTILLIFKYCITIFKLKTIEFLHYYIQEDWKMIQTNLENDIMLKHTHNFRNYIVFVFCSTGFSLLIMIIIQFFPVILDFILPLDEPRSRNILIKVEYFMSQDNYFYTIVFHEMVVLSLYLLIMLATTIQLLLFSWHSFGMFKIASHRIQFFLDDYILHTPNCERAICEKIIHIVRAHRRAMEFSNTTMSSFNVTECILIVFGMVSLCINLFRFVRVLTMSRNIEDLFISFGSITCHLTYMFVANYIGEMATNYNNNIFRLTYNISWYLMPVASQKLILFLMTRASKDFYFILGVIFIVKLDNFTMLINIAFSYVNTMYSIQ